jgi:hypothetical protein
MLKKWAIGTVLALLLVLAVSAAAQGCYGDPSCYGQPQPDPSVNAPPIPPWEGFSDGRLNPDMAEYYSVWCVNSEVRVLRAVPPPTVQVDALPIADVAALSDGGVLTRESGLTVVRSGDTITLSGNNGNLAPQPGSKSFSRTECFDRIGAQVLDEGLAETREQNLQYCAENFDPDICPEDDMLPFELAWRCAGELLRVVQPSEVCEAYDDIFILGSAVAWIVILGVNNCGASAAAVVLAPGGLGYYGWRRTRTRKQMYPQTIQKEQ